MNPLLKRLHVALVLAVVLFSAIAGTPLVDLGRANPYLDGGEVPPDSSTKPPRILIFAPQNNTVYAINTIPFSINVSLPESKKAVETSIDIIYYEADWQQDRVYLYASGTVGFDYQISSTRSRPENRYFQYSQDFTGIPDGNHSILVYALGRGSYVKGMYGYGFHINASSSVSFIINTNPPKVSILSVENKKYITSDIPLNFTVNEPVSWMGYCLDGQANVTIAGNTTLTGLSDGSHSLTVYAKDAAGSIGASETVYFNIETFSITWNVAATAIIAIPIVLAIPLGAMLYRKRRKH